MLDTIDYADKHNIDALLLSIDYEKAFDRVHYESLYEALQLFNFGTNMIKWIKILFTDIAPCTQNNGFSSEYFQPTRGLFQGNPISSYGFLIIIELLAVMIRSNEKIEGIDIQGIKNLLAMFADDMCIFIKRKEKVWHALLQTLRD